MSLIEGLLYNLLSRIYKCVHMTSVKLDCAQKVDVPDRDNESANDLGWIHMGVTYTAYLIGP